MKIRMIFLIVGISIVCLAAFAATEEVSNAPVRWTTEKAWDWYSRQNWLAGFNYVPSTACNTTEWWQKETFDPNTIDREFGWAENIGYNTTRAFIQYIVWKQDPKGFKERFQQFLKLADKHKLTVMPVLFDDCAFGDPLQYDPFLGKQREPIPGMILPSWTPSPGKKIAGDPNEKPMLKKYVQDMVGTFGKDKRIIAWDLFNEPMNVARTGTNAFLTEIFDWARQVNPQQPLTIATWDNNKELNNCITTQSDVITFHWYSDTNGITRRIAEHKVYGRPVINSEWMARAMGSRFDTDLPVFKAEGVGCYQWGLVSGRTQCQFPWWNKKGGTVDPNIGWFHDIFYQDGKAYRDSEVAAIRKILMDKKLNLEAAKSIKKMLETDKQK